MRNKLGIQNFSLQFCMYTLQFSHLFLRILSSVSCRHNRIEKKIALQRYLQLFNSQFWLYVLQIWLLRMADLSYNSVFITLSLYCISPFWRKITELWEKKSRVDPIQQHATYKYTVYIYYFVQTMFPFRILFWPVRTL